MIKKYIYFFPSVYIRNKHLYLKSAEMKNKERRVESKSKK